MKIKIWKTTLLLQTQPVQKNKMIKKKGKMRINTDQILKNFKEKKKLKDLLPILAFKSLFLSFPKMESVKKSRIIFIFRILNKHPKLLLKKEVIFKEIAKAIKVEKHHKKVKIINMKPTSIKQKIIKIIN